MSEERTSLIFWTAVSGIAVWAWFSLPSIDHPLGSDWGHYFTVAQYIWDPVDGLAYPDFRKPWFGWLMGGAGQGLGYFDAAQLIGRSSMVAIVFSASLLGAALGGRWCGLASGLTVPLMPLVMDGALWVNHYPLLGATVGLSFAAGAMSVRRKHPGWIIVAGLMAGASFAIDLRGSIAIPVVLVLVGIGVFRWGWWSSLKRLLLVGGCVGAVLAHDAWLQSSFDVPQLEFQSQLAVQRKGTLGQIAQGVFDDVPLQAACGSQVVRALNFADVRGECGERLALASHQRLASLRIVPNIGLIWFLSLVCLPAQRERKWRFESTLASMVVFGAPLLSVWVGMRWVTYFDRYLLPFSVLFACGAPVAFSRVAGLLARIHPLMRGWSHLLAGLGAVWVSFTVWPGWTARSLDSPELARSSEYHAGIFAKWARDEVRLKDSVLDCAGLAIDSLLLPSQIDYVRFPPGDPSCDSRIRSPEPTSGRAFLITMHRDIPPQYSSTKLSFNPKKIGEAGWVAVDHDLDVDGFRLWERK